MAQKVDVRIHSSRHKPDGKTFFSLADTCAGDAIILAVPIHAFEETLTRILPLTAEYSIVVDIATVKTYTATLLKKYAGGRRYLATHPMFGPESYAKRDGNVSGIRVVIAEHTLRPEEYTHLKDALSSIGFVVIEMTADEHDRQLADTLFLVHFIGQSVLQSGFARTEIDTVSFGFLMDAVESIRHDKELFTDVFRFNPYCEEALQRLRVAEEKVRTELGQDS